MYDAAIVGGGPAGLTAAVYAARKQLQVVMVTLDIGGQTNLTADIENYMGFEYISGAELAAKFREQLDKFPIDLRLGALVKTITPHDDHFLLDTTDNEQIETRTVIISTGKHSRKLGVPGEVELIGRGVSYCAICDGPFFKGMPVAVVGGGNSGVEAALSLSRVATHVTLIEVTDTWRADAVLLQQAHAARNLDWRVSTQVVEILGSDKVEGVVIESVPAGARETLPVEGLFIEIGLTPNTDWLGGLVQLNQWGEIVVDCATATSVPGIFAAGDVASTPQKQIIIAAGEGAKAGLSAYEYLLRRGELAPVSSW
ncbi:MAG TPA: FAD-dependent oxidoreductase [Armatimonadota bacterium]